ncbi:hypothetical protein TSTA_053010 [Talaromyces stipitatus ATCC 10500]|uniref:Uncharacterized protein n=1 Tax=Talaromyces stipitatus (strain ATCC 10500 / CBS 375.48 / QM 6759 / NRRL 1006) TaxID=441959 RepID=B8MQU8_TALSN|nr:uncharacterized protein TSTA_053010 [Talaromyces stipitatus ATCC 10500]EED12783.1 hypothetical protein TSTA_053010 [Talaromyces stipitatus ATCC 10500]
MDKERSLAGTLAFIWSIRDDTDHIPAVCVVEEPNSNCMGILLAVNRVGFNDGTNILRDLKQGFDKIFHILAGRLDGERDASSTENEVFTAIVSMCTSRILSRLGLIPGRKRSRKSVKDSLSEAIDCTRRLDNSRNPHKNSCHVVRNGSEGIDQAYKFLVQPPDYGTTRKPC